MKDYLEYIEESTNTVKIKTRLSKLLVVLCYLVIWAFNIMASWRFSAGSITEAQAGGTQWIMLPAAPIVLSLLIGKKIIGESTSGWRRLDLALCSCFPSMRAMA